jgi:Ca-activated chloride channel family protein
MKKLIPFLLLLLLTACGSEPNTIYVVTNAGADDYIRAAAAAVNNSGLDDANGNGVRVEVITLEAGAASVQLGELENPADIWIPDNNAWTDVAAERGITGFDDCVSVAESPLVIGMWREVAALLGYPGRELGWLDIGSLAADATAWDYYSGGQYGETLRLGHTHPGLSASGASTLLALVQSAESKTTPVTPADIDQPIVRASVGAFESGVAWFSQDTETLGATMAARGSSYLGAGVMYESTVLAEGGGQLVSIYPFEGTFMATHPACVNDGSANKAGAIAFRDWLRGAEGQALAVTYGLRPIGNVDSSSLTLAGADLSQPVIVFGESSADSIFAVQELWQAARKPIHLAMILDTSGSMDGEKIDNMKAAAVEFVQQMADGDYLTLIEFYSSVDIKSQRAKIGDERAGLIRIIEEMEAGGDTSLYDAIGRGGEILAELNAADTANALVVLTDGEDTSSARYANNTTLGAVASANNTTVFTIGYGRGADTSVLQDIALAANGQFFYGDEASIAAIYDELSAAFGGSVGIGR